MLLQDLCYRMHLKLVTNVADVCMYTLLKDVCEFANELTAQKTRLMYACTTCAT